jgi:hypothetical protein
MVYVGRTERRCPECESWPPEKREDILRAETKARAEKPSITTADLTDDERKTLKEWTISYPNTSQMTLLTWIEGARYNPSEDKEFLAEARKRFKKWKFLRLTNDGPPPQWAKNALASGSNEGLSSEEKEFVETLRRIG